MITLRRLCVCYVLSVIMFVLSSMICGFMLSLEAYYYGVIFGLLALMHGINASSIGDEIKKMRSSEDKKNEE